MVRTPFCGSTSSDSCRRPAPRRWPTRCAWCSPPHALWRSPASWSAPAGTARSWAASSAPCPHPRPSPRAVSAPPPKASTALAPRFQPNEPSTSTDRRPRLPAFHRPMCKTASWPFAFPSHRDRGVRTLIHRSEAGGAVPRQRSSARRCATVSACGRSAWAPSCSSARTAAPSALRSVPGSAAPTWVPPKRASVSAGRSS
jgi:hypothetical protein